MTSAPRNILIGTAGHIDHGKTSLVRCLTGIDTDRLPEEKLRGISIDLGFAHFEHGGIRFGVVDVPGHERFVRNMVAGATGINLALLVVAADDGVMPQTREHLEIMDLLGLQTGVIVITKADLVDAEMLALVRADIMDAVADTFLEGAPIVSVSSTTGSGIEQLQETLVQVCQQVELPETLPLFRLAVDRVFSIPGHGTVVTGSTLSGEVHVGDSLDLWPEGRLVRVRDVERHGEHTDIAGSRQRTAINLAGVRHDEVRRGCELATPGYLQATQRMLVELRVLARSQAPINDRMEVSLHLGTLETHARVVLPCRVLEAGQTGYAELRPAEPVVAVWGQRFIVRRISPAMTIGGGRVLDPSVSTSVRRRDIESTCEGLASTNAVDRLSVVLKNRDTFISADRSILSAIGVMPAQLELLLRQLRDAGVLIRVGSGDRGVEMHAERLAGLASAVLKRIRDEIQIHQPRRSLPKLTLLSACRNLADPTVVEAVFEKLVAEKQVLCVGDNYGPADLQVKLTKQQRATYESLLQQIAAAGLSPPTEKELAQALNQKPADVNQLLKLATDEGVLVRVADGLFYTPAALETARTKCRSLLNEIQSATVAQLRDAWGVTRKHSIPICEYFDLRGITARSGDVRVAGPAIDNPVATTS